MSALGLSCFHLFWLENAGWRGVLGAAAVFWEGEAGEKLMSVRGGGLMRPPPLTRPASFMWVSGLLAPKLVAIVQRLLTRCGGRRTQDASTAVLGARSVSDSSEVWLRNRGARIFGTRK